MQFSWLKLAKLMEKDLEIPIRKYTEKDLENMTRNELNELIMRKLAEREEIVMKKRPMIPLPKYHYNIWKFWAATIVVGAIALFWAKKDVKTYRSDNMKIRQDMMQDVLAKRAAEKDAKMREMVLALKDSKPQ